MTHELMMQYGISIKNRSIFLLGDIEKENTINVLKGFSILSAKQDEITLVVKSDGGDIDDAFAIYDIMKSIPNSIRTISIGNCSSCAPLLVAAGTPNRRFSLPNCRFMVHDLWIENLQDVDLNAVRKEVKFHKLIDNIFCDLMGQNTKMIGKDWRRLCRESGEVNFDAKKALKYGIIDFIVPTIDWSKRDAEKAP